MLEVVPLPLLRDNYAYLLIDPALKSAVVVDPSESEPVLRALSERGLSLAGIWCTHHHVDHVGGVEGLLDALSEMPVLGSAYDAGHSRIPAQRMALDDGDVVEHGGEKFRVLEVPGHTLGAIAYVGERHVFTGDTLFLAGCGRVFEGTMPMMRASLARLRALPPELSVCCGHEYTESNLGFAATVEPDSQAVRARLEKVRAQRAAGEITVPGPLSVELETNPFLRWDVDAVRGFAASYGDSSTDDEVFARVREAKDRF